MPPLQLIFLGTGGGRFTTVTQKRKTAGIRILDENANIHLDPGPGALVHSIRAGLDPQKIDAVVVSHCHVDHYTDAEVFIEAMTRGTVKKRGILAASSSVLRGNEVCGPSISQYHQKMPSRLIEAKPGIRFQIGDVRVLVTEARHTDPDTVGFRFDTPDVGDVAYTSETEYFEGVGKQYRDVRLLILCVMRPAGKPWKGHMTTDDAIKIVREAEPERAVITHFGMQMIFRGHPAEQAKLIQQETGVPTMAAMDGTRITVAEEVREQKLPRGKQYGLEQFT